MKLRRRQLIIAAIAVAALFAAGAGLRSIYGSGVASRPFDSAEWRRATPIANHRTTRSEMVDDLLRHHDFTGWTRQQVIDLLGPPTPKWSGFEQWSIFYVLGLERSGPFFLDDEALGFTLDSSDRVFRYAISVN